MDDTLYPIQCYIGIIDQPFPVCIFENIIERPVHKFQQRVPLQFFHLFIAIAENEICPFSIFVKNQFNDTEGQGHIVKDVKLFSELQTIDLLNGGGSRFVKTISLRGTAVSADSKSTPISHCKNIVVNRRYI